MADGRRLQRRSLAIAIISRMGPETRYARLHGHDIAYQVLGDGPPDLVLSAGSYNHTEVQWEDPAVGVFLRRLASFCRLIRFDMLGAGGSDRWPPDRPTPTFGEQIEVVMQETGSERAVLLAMLDATPGAIEFVVEHPDRVSKLILYAASARLIRADDYDVGLDEAAVAGVASLLEAGWGTPAMAQANVPSRANDEHFVAWYSKYLRSIGTPTEISRRFGVHVSQDVRHLLRLVPVPTLVLHRRDYALIPFAHARYLADHIPDARLVELPGADGPLFWETPDLILREIERFVTGTDRPARSPRQVLTLVFTDIADSTRRAEEMGDRDWLALLEQHDEISASRAAQYGGWVVKGTGDGVLAAFSSPSDAVSAARTIRDDLSRMGVGIRAGVHAGEVERSEDEVSGLGVHIAARVMALADAGEILVSRTVRDLTVGSSFRFEDACTHQLKGVADSWQLFRIVSDRDRPGVS